MLLQDEGSATSESFWKLVQRKYLEEAGSNCMGGKLGSAARAVWSALKVSARVLDTASHESAAAQDSDKDGTPHNRGQTRFSSASTESEVFDPTESWALSEGSYGDSIAAMHNISKDLVKAVAPTKETLAVEKVIKKSQLSVVLLRLRDLCQRRQKLPKDEPIDELLEEIRVTVETIAREMPLVQQTLSTMPGVKALELTIALDELLNQVFDAVLGGAEINFQMLEKLSAEGQALLLVHENKASSIEKIRSSIFSRSQYSSEEPGPSSIDRHSENLIDRHSENLPKCPQDESDHIREASRIFCREPSHQKSADWNIVQDRPSTEQTQRNMMRSSKPSSARARPGRLERLCIDPKAMLLKEVERHQRPGHVTLEAVCLRRLMRPWCQNPQHQATPKALFVSSCWACS